MTLRAPGPTLPPKCTHEPRCWEWLDNTHTSWRWVETPQHQWTGTTWADRSTNQ